MSKYVRFKGLTLSAEFALASMIMLLMMTPAAWAQEASSFGAVLCLAFDNAKPFAPLFTWIAYIAGVSAALRGVYHLKAHADSPANNKLGVALMYLFGSMCLLALPSFIGMVEQSLFSVEAEGGALACDPGAVSGALQLDEMVESFVSNIKVPMRAVLSVTAGLAGLYMIISGLMKASKAGLDPKTHNPHVILTNVGFGAMLMMIGTNLTTLLGSVFGTEEILELSSISWNTPAPEASQQFNNAINAALTFVQIIGGIAFVRGWLILKKVVEGTTNDPLAKALTHILGGCLAINIGKFLEIMDATFGTNLLTSA